MREPRKQSDEEHMQEAAKATQKGLLKNMKNPRQKKTGNKPDTAI